MGSFHVAAHSKSYSHPVFLRNKNILLKTNFRKSQLNLLTVSTTAPTIQLWFLTLWALQMLLIIIIIIIIIIIVKSKN